MKTIINIKADKEVKENAQKLAKELGLPLSTIMNAYLKAFIRNRSVYFSQIPRMSRELESILGSIERDIVKKKNISRPLRSYEEVSHHLDSL